MELRIAIDRAMRSPQPRWLKAVAALVHENPRGWESSHVRHNVGEARRAFVAQVVTTQGRSLAKESHAKAPTTGRG